MNKPKFVFDTNVFISAVLLEGSVNAAAIDKAFKIGDIIISDATFSEFTEVIYRKKFDRYLSNERRVQVISKLKRDTVSHTVKVTIIACRDAKDDKYLELTVDCKADCIVTGDKDLLVLHPFRCIPILSTPDFLSHTF